MVCHSLGFSSGERAWAIAGGAGQAGAARRVSGSAGRRQQAPLALLTTRPGPQGIIDAAYRFARHETGVDVVLFGTGFMAHLQTNIRSILADPLPAAILALVQQRFGHLVGVGLDAPSNAPGPGG